MAFKSGQNALDCMQFWLLAVCRVASACSSGRLAGLLCHFSSFPASSKHAKTLGTVAKINSPLPGWPGRRPMCSFYRVLRTKVALTLQKPEENTGSGRPPRRRHLGLLEPSRVAFGQLRPPRPPDGFDLGQCSASRGKNNECPERFEHFPRGRRASENGNRPKRRNCRQV